MSRIVPETIDAIIRLDKELAKIKEQCDELTRTKEMCDEKHKKTKEKRDAYIKSLPPTFGNYEPQKPFNLSVMMESLPSTYNLTNPKIKQDERTRYDKEMEIYHEELRIRELFKKFKQTGSVGGKRRKTRRRQLFR
jgi:hypothetical protein